MTRAPTAQLDPRQASPTITDAFDALMSGRAQPEPPATDFGGPAIERRSISEQVANRILGMIKSVNLTNLSRTGADIELTYLGDEVQFVRALSQANLMITNSGEGLQTMTLAAPGTIPPVQDNGAGDNSGTGDGSGTDSGGDLTQPAAPQ